MPERRKFIHEPTAKLMGAAEIWEDGQRIATQTSSTHKEQSMDTKSATILSRYIVADPRICHGKPTFRGTRIMVADVLEQMV